MSNNVYYVPEYEKDSSSYFARAGVYRSSTPEIVQDFALWVLVNNLDTATAPAVVVATQMDGVESYMYPITFNQSKSSEIPDQFDVIDINGKNIFFLPHDRFLQVEASQPCIQVPGNRWAPHALNFHILAAFYRLSVVPSLSLSLFTRTDLFDSVCEKFQSMYQMHGSVTQCLSQMFNDLYFALDFFGFADPACLAEKNSIEAVRKIVAAYQEIKSSPPNDFPRLFAFSELKFAIINYHRECFPNRTIAPDILSLETYNSLSNTVSFVHRVLSNLGFMSETSPIDGLKDAVVRFQRNNGLPPGVCDMFTLRHIWNASLPNGCDFIALCRLSGMDVQENIPPKYESTLPPLHVPNPTPEFQAIEDALNSVITQIKDHSEAPIWMMDEAKKSLNRQIERVNKATSEAEKIDQQITEIEKRLQAACSENDAAAEKFGAASTVLLKVQEEHMAMKKEFEEVKKTLETEKKGNQILLIVIVILGFLVLSRWIKKV